VNVYPIQTSPEGDGAKCPNCGAPVAADQRYCLACGQPCSPVRLAFLDVLQAENDLRVAPIAISSPAAGYLPPSPQDDGALGRLRRYSGLLGLLAVLLIAGLIGLLVGHWLAPSKAPGVSVIKLEGSLPAAATSAPAATTPTATTPASPSKTATTKSAPATEAQEVKEVKEAEKTAASKPKAVTKPSAATLDKLSTSKGKTHQKEIEKLTEGDKPIETGG
jgi:predicted lipid-binding transport protein (Tim44 family)